MILMHRCWRLIIIDTMQGVVFGRDGTRVIDRVKIE